MLKRTELRRLGPSEDIDPESSPRTPTRHLGDVKKRRHSHGMLPDSGLSPRNGGNRVMDSPSHENGVRHRRQQSASSNLGSSMMRTVVASGNDALNILFEAAVAHRPGNNIAEHPVQSEDTLSSRSQTTREDNEAFSYRGHPKTSARGRPVQISHASKEILDVWEACRFVKMGWFTSREAVTLTDLSVRCLTLC